MIVTWMLYALLISALVAAAAAGVEAVCRAVGAPVRWVWAAAMLLSLALVGVAPGRMAGPPAQLPAGLVVTSEVSSDRWVAPRESSFAWKLMAAEVRAMRGVRAALAAAGRRAPERSGVFLVLLWAAVTLVSLLVIGATHLRTRRERRKWPASEVQGLRVRVAPDLGPAVIGVARPEIVVPRWFFRLTPDETRLVLAHESEHIRAGDPILLTLGWTAAALLPWSPAVWWMLARLRLAVEVDCDRRVLGRGADPRSYGSVLIDLAGRPSRLSVGMLALADPPSQLERRLLAMSFQRTRSARARAAGIGALSGLVLAAACAAELPTAGEIQRIDVAAAEAAATRVALLQNGAENTVYTFDGETVNRQTALSIPSDRIASVSVVKARTPAGAAEIAIISRNAGDTVDVVIGRRRAGGATEPAADEGGRTGSALPQARPEPIYIVDGERQASAPMDRLRPDSVESVHVIKDSDFAVKLAGPDAVNGLVVIRTRGGKPDGLDLQRPVRVRGTSQYAPKTTLAPAVQPVYLINGVRSTEAAFHALDRADIESVTVSKDAAAVKLLGPEGKNGVVEIRTKAAAR
ncbi:MAG: hypothetical protein KY464_13720 [Gemmatimonadetes bacterium]|nr:hypothetical protein [Gemmatimonadota bacterium]